MPFCVKCGTDGDGEFCATCGHPRGVDSSYIGARQRYDIELAAVSAMCAQRHGVPAIASFFWPGLGQLIKGQILMGLGVMFLAAVFFVLSWFVVGVPLLFVLWIAQLYDAYVTPDADASFRMKALKQSGPPG